MISKFDHLCCYVLSCTKWLIHFPTLSIGSSLISASKTWSDQTNKNQNQNQNQPTSQPELVAKTSPLSVGLKSVPEHFAGTSSDLKKQKQKQQEKIKKVVFELKPEAATCLSCKNIVLRIETMQVSRGLFHSEWLSPPSWDLGPILLNLLHPLFTNFWNKLECLSLARFSSLDKQTLYLSAKIC